MPAVQKTVIFEATAAEQGLVRMEGLGACEWGYVRAERARKRVIEGVPLCTQAFLTTHSSRFGMACEVLSPLVSLLNLSFSSEGLSATPTTCAITEKSCLV